MTVRERYDFNYDSYILSNPCGENKWDWAASEVFGLTTYDNSIDKIFVKDILEVCKVILEKKNFEYIKDEANYIKYLTVCQLLDNFAWLEWGSSIRGAWFLDGEESRPILYEEINDIPFTEENLRILIEFIEEEE